MAQRIQLKRGVHAALPTSGMLAGEPLITTDRGTLHVATDETTKIAVTPAIDALSAIGAVDGTSDLLIMHDSNATGQKEKKITFNDFKSALNIPVGASDEKVSVVGGGTSGYLYGTTGADGILRMGPSMAWVKDAGNGFVTIDAAVIDGGTF